MAGAISFGGLGNGFDFHQVVAGLVQLQRQPIVRLSQNQQALQSKITDYGVLGTKLLALQSAANALRSRTSFDRSAVTVPDETVLSAAGSPEASPGTYTIAITQLASGHQLTHKAAHAVSSPTASIVSGQSATFSFAVGTEPVETITLEAGATLDDLRVAINDRGAGVVASVLNTGTDQDPAYRLVLTSTQTGAAYGVTISDDTTELDFLNATGTGGTDTLQAAQDAVVVFGDPAQTPITIQRSSNTIGDAISGVTLNLKQVMGNGQTTTVTVSRDVDAIVTNIQAMVTAYNDIVSFINQRNTYDAAAKKGGVFFGEGAPKTILSRLGRALSTEIDGLAAHTAVGQLGFETQRDGTIKVNETVLRDAMSQSYTAVKDVFINRITTSGVAQRLYEEVDLLDDVTAGVLTIRQQGLTERMRALTEQIQRKEDALSAYEERLRLQFAALDGLLRQMQSQSDYLNARLLQNFTS